MVRSNPGHTHGDPGLECTIPNCRYPDARFLCGLKVKGWRAGATRGLCVLPQQHRGQSSCADQHGNLFMVEPELEWDPGDKTGPDLSDWRLEQVEDAIDLASDQDQMTWLTADGKRIAAIVPVEMAETAIRFTAEFAVELTERKFRAAGSAGGRFPVERAAEQRDPVREAARRDGWNV